MKKHLISLSVFLAVGGMLYFANINTGHSRASGTGIQFCSASPYDGSDCTGCHGSYAMLKVPSSKWLTTSIPAAGWSPGVTYTITCRAISTTAGQNSNFGFECTPQDQSSGAVIGTLANISTTGSHATQIIASAPSQWMTHTSASYTGTDSNYWAFKWTAPKTGYTKVTFYACYNCGSGDMQSSAQIYWDSLQVMENTTAVNQIAAENGSFNVYPNPIKDQFNVNYSLQQAQQVEVNLYSIDGKHIGSLLPNAEQSAGDHNQVLHMPSVTTGIYLLQFVAGDQVSFKKVVVE